MTDSKPGDRVTYNSAPTWIELPTISDDAWAGLNEWQKTVAFQPVRNVPDRPAWHDDANPLEIPWP